MLNSFGVRLYFQCLNPSIDYLSFVSILCEGDDANQKFNFRLGIYIYIIIKVLRLKCFTWNLHFETFKTSHTSLVTSAWSTKLSTTFVLVIMIIFHSTLSGLFLIHPSSEPYIMSGANYDICHIFFNCLYLVYVLSFFSHLSFFGYYFPNIKLILNSQYFPKFFSPLTLHLTFVSLGNLSNVF